MPFKKPFRICNEIKLAAPDFTATATLKELEDRFELRISIPDKKSYSYAICISDGVLYVHEGKKPPENSGEFYCSFMLPANVIQNRVTALYRSYGLKILMPILPHNGIVFHVPITREQE